MGFGKNFKLLLTFLLFICFIIVAWIFFDENNPVQSLIICGIGLLICSLITYKIVRGSLSKEKKGTPLPSGSIEASRKKQQKKKKQTQKKMAQKLYKT